MAGTPQPAERDAQLTAGGGGRWAPRLKLRHGVLLLILALGFLFRHPLATNARVALLISQEFSLGPVKPLSLVTRPPVHRRIFLRSPHGPVVADLFLPRPWLGSRAVGSTSAIILAFGVKVPASARSQVLSFAGALARLGYITLWPRLRAIDRGEPRLEEPSTFLTAFSYLETVPTVNRSRISFVGISVGASIAFVAASNPRIARQVRSIFFFGGYFDISSYLVSLAMHRDSFGGRPVRWQPSRDAISQVKSVLRKQRMGDLLHVFQAKSVSQARRIVAGVIRREPAALRRFSPYDHIRSFRARIFVLHDRGDQYVPYVESEKLYQALPARIGKSLLLSNVFRHVEPSGGNALQLLQLYRFVYQVMSYL